MNRNSVRSRPMPGGAGLGDQRQLDRQLQVGLQLDRLAVRRLRRQPAQPGIASAARGRRRRRRGARRPASAGAGFSVTVPAVPSTTTMSPGRDRMRQPGGAEHRRHAERAQHHRGVAVGAAFLGGDAGQPRRIEQRRVGRAQRLRRPGSRPPAGRRSCGTGRGSGCAPAGGRFPAPPRRGAAGRRGPRPTCRARPGPGWRRRSPRLPSTTALSADSSVSSMRRRTPRTSRDGPSMRI